MGCHSAVQGDSARLWGKGRARCCTRPNRPCLQGPGLPSVPLGSIPTSSTAFWDLRLHPITTALRLSGDHLWLFGTKCDLSTAQPRVSWLSAPLHSLHRKRFRRNPISQHPLPCRPRQRGDDGSGFQKQCSFFLSASCTPSAFRLPEHAFPSGLHLLPPQLS